MSTLVGVVPTIRRLLLRLVQIIVSRILALWYRGEPQGIATPKSSILMESASSLAAKIRQKKLTSREVVQTFIERINEINGVLNCVVDKRFEEALEEAEKIDEYIASGNSTDEELRREKPFLGVPFTTKDSIAVAGSVQSAGIIARKNCRAEKDAEVVALMRKAGGIPLAITNVSELCFWWECTNSVFGRTNNPYNTNRTAGGSTGGEACLITSCGSPIGIGSDIGGSVRIPAAFNGIFAHKPSMGITPVSGLFPKLAPSRAQFNTVGPMSRFSSDLLPALRVMTANCNLDLGLDDRVDVKKLKCYYMEDDGGYLTSPVDVEVRNAVNKAAEFLKKKHGVATERVSIEKMQFSMDIWMAKMATDDGPQISSLLTNNEGRINVSREILKAIAGMSKHTITTLLMAFMEETVAPSNTLKNKIYASFCNDLQKTFEEMLGEDGIFIYPTQPSAALYHYETLVRPFDFSYTGIFNILGLPATHCPMGMNSEGLPVGVQVIAGRNKDRLTLAVAQELEEAFGGWKPSPTRGTLVLKNNTLIHSKSS